VNGKKRERERLKQLDKKRCREKEKDVNICVYISHKSKAAYERKEKLTGRDANKSKEGERKREWKRERERQIAKLRASKKTTEIEGKRIETTSPVSSSSILRKSSPKMAGRAKHVCDDARNIVARTFRYRKVLPRDVIKALAKRNVMIFSNMENHRESGTISRYL